jgi:serine/threonine-protein kinase
MRGRHEVGERVGEWTLVRAIGEGGTALVFEATGPDGARAAVKILAHELALDSTLCARFSREAYIANGIDHPGVVRVLADGRTDDGTPFLVMELLEGETFENRRIRKGGRLPVDEVLWTMDEALAVLAAAHAKGVVHRDVKPENLFMTSDGRVKLLDFGIARLVDADSTAMTRVGSVLGTLAYMAPEQARGSINEVGVASDVWGVGATMFTLLSGRWLREDEGGVSVLIEAGQRGVVSLGEVAPDVPKPVVAVVDAALSFDPAVRWPNATTMRRVVHLTRVELVHRQQRLEGEVSSETFVDVRVNPSIAPPPRDIERLQSSLRPPPKTAAPPAPARAMRPWWIAVAAVVVALLVVVAYVARISGTR